MYNPNQQEDNLEKTKDSLYSKNTDGIFLKKRHTLKDNADAHVPFAWHVENEKAESSFQIPYTKILIGAFIFFAVAIGFTFFKFFSGNNVVSGNNIDILVSGPVSIAGGEELPLEINVKNNNNVDLKVVDLGIVFPDGTKSATDQSSEMKRYTEVLGDISVGKSEQRLIKAVLYGEENSTKVIKITVEYRVSGSNAVFSKEKDFNVLISSSPVNISVDGPTEINTNQSINFSIDIDSNSTNVVKNLILKATYPFGFSFVSSSPKTTSTDGSVFAIGDLAPGEKRNIKISGTISGQDGEERVFKFTVGNPSQDDSNTVGTPMALYESSVLLQKSSVGLEVAVNQNTDSVVAIASGNKNTVNILWKNNLAENIYNMAVQIKMSGQIFDKESVQVSNGYYNSADNTIIFNKTNNSTFATVSPSDEGELTFNFNTISTQFNGSSLGNSALKFDITVLGDTTSSNSSASQETLYTGSKTLKLSSALKLLSRGFRTIGPFENSGPFPPQADSETTYTITWTATDSFNSITGAKVSAFLSPNVVWTGYTSPDTENVTYNKNTGEVVWNIGDMKAGVGSSYTAKSASFQVAITPSINDVGSEINLLNEATISGVDAFTGARIGEVKNAVTTNITSDPAYTDNAGKVVK